MFSFSKAFFAAFLTTAADGASFEKDVVGGPIRSLPEKLVLDNNRILPSPILEKDMTDPSSALHQDLLSKALPIKEFEAKHGVDLHRDSRRQLYESDDFAMNGYDMISFSGYSLKFAKCQPVQYFSERALQRGEHSPMITNDIVILRLCPTSSCSESAEYGCQYNFSEYAMELAEYIRIMLYYSATKRDYMCNYCNRCLYNGKNGYNRARRKTRRLGDENDRGEDDASDGENQDEGQQHDEEQDNEQQEHNNENQDDNVVDDAGNSFDYSSFACNSWSTYCTEYEDYCLEQNVNASAYMDFEDYGGYIYCSQVDYGDYAYFVKPRCDAYQGTIKMGIFYDKYCNQYAGNEVSLENVGMGFRENVFQEYYSSTCLDCSESVSLGNSMDAKSNC